MCETPGPIGKKQARIFEKCRIAIITDGGFSMGMGHVYRTISLANRLSLHAIVQFITQSDEVVVNKIKGNNFSIRKVDDLKEMKDFLCEYRPDVVVIDKLYVDEEFAEFIKVNLFAKLVIFGNVSAANHHADLVINAVIGTDYKNTSYVDKKRGTLYLEGPRYLVLRREFYSMKNTYKFRNKLEKILLLFGGSDPANLTSKVLAKLLEMNPSFKITVVLGSAFQFDDVVHNLLKRKKAADVVVHIDVNNVYNYMVNSDLVLTSPGTTMFESFCIGTPTVAFYQNPSQREIFHGFGPLYEFDKIVDFKNFLYRFYSKYVIQKVEIDKLEVGEGKENIINAILSKGDK
ncbi:MAG: UDP-2,4-diacetamido-2,4,6-trideoxy-beta-L-altropyranose hydrolase [Gammaproteobacteria bacterium]